MAALSIFRTLSTPTLTLNLASLIIWNATAGIAMPEQQVDDIAEQGNSRSGFRQSTKRVSPPVWMGPPGKAVLIADIEVHICRECNIHKNQNSCLCLFSCVGQWIRNVIRRLHESFLALCVSSEIEGPGRGRSIRRAVAGGDKKRR